MTSPDLIIYNLFCSHLGNMTWHPEKKALFLFMLLTLALSACDRNRLYEEHVALAKGVWNVRQPLTFDADIADRNSKYTVYLNVRNGNEYPYSNLYLFMKTEFPDGKIARDTIELTLADYDGRWLGSGMGSVKFSRFLFRKDVRFPQTGSYHFILEQGMRVTDLPGIFDIGLRIEKQ
jgi:gliding motility-associated lipoprotein GldH